MAKSAAERMPSQLVLSMVICLAAPRDDVGTADPDAARLDPVHA
jgi:hypothetical protein